MPKISFIVSAFNRPDHLRTCLSSLICQTEEDWEAMVVDNGADYAKRNLSICSDLGDRRIDHCYTGERTIISDTIHAFSLYDAAEIGVRKTTGEWLCFPNDDSYYCPWFAERMLAYANAAQWDLVYCDLVAGGVGGHYYLSVAPRTCQIDKTCFMVKREWFTGFGHPTGDDYPQADGKLIEGLVTKGIKHGRVPQILVVHN